MMDIFEEKQDFESVKNDLAEIQQLIQLERKVPKIRSFSQIKDHLNVELMYLSAHQDRTSELDSENQQAKMTKSNNFLDLTDEMVFPPTSQFVPTDLMMRKLIMAAFQQWETTNY